MLLTIHNLPGDIRFADIKDLIREKCGLTELILDNLINEGSRKCVTVGLADGGDAALLVRNINGLFLKGSQLYVEDVRQKKVAEQPYQPMPTSQQKWQPPTKQNQKFEPPPVPTGIQYPQEMVSLGNQPPFPQSYNNMPFYMAQAQTSQVNYDPLTSLPTNLPQQVMFYQQDMTSFMYPQPDVQNQWNKQGSITYPQKTTMPNMASQIPDDRFSQKRDAEKDNRDFSRAPEGNWNNKGQFEPHKGNKDFRNRNSEGYDNKNYRPNALKEQEDKYRNEKQSSPRRRDRFQNRSINKGDERHNNDFQSSSRSSRFDRSPPRNRSSQRDLSPQRDRFRSRESPERVSKYPGFNEQEQQQFHHRDFGKNDHYSGFNETEQRNDRQGSFGSKRPYPNLPEKNPKTYGNDPDNSTFSKSNENIFRQQGPKKGFNMQNRQHDINLGGPPAKFAKFSRDGGKVTPRGSQPGMNLPNPSGNVPSETITAKLMKHSNWREHAAGILAGKVIANANVRPAFIKNYKEVVQNLRKCIMSRIDVILGDKVVNSLNEMIDSYRLKFSVDDDAGFYRAVLEKLERDNEENPTWNAPGPSKTGKNYTGQPNNRENVNQKNMYRNNRNPGKQTNFMNKQNQKQFPNKQMHGKQKKFANAQNQNKNIPQQTSGRLPKYPEANKQVYKDQKKIQRLEFQDGSIYNLEPVLRNALIEEMDKLCEAFVSVCTESSDKEEDSIRQKIAKKTVKTFRKVVRVHVTKRLLDVRTNLVVRMFAHPKPPNRDELDAFLRSVGAVNLKKSERKKMFMATCDTYENYDKLLALKSTKIGDCELSFKPLYLTGPPDKKNNKSKKTDPNLLSDDEVSTDEEDDYKININEKDELDVSQDVVLLDDDKEVVTIDDSDHKDTNLRESTEELKNNDAEVNSNNDEATINETLNTADGNKESDVTEINKNQSETNNVEKDILDSVDDFAEDDLEDF